MEKQKQYEKYMKNITDAFIDMQSEDTTEPDTPQFTTGFKLIEWKGGIHYTTIIDGTLWQNGMTHTDAKKHNAEIALKYLYENTITIDE